MGDLSTTCKRMFAARFPGRRLILWLCTVTLFSCTEKVDPLLDQQSFTRIYDNNRFDASYSPIDMVQTPDGGYLMLGSRRLPDTSFSGIYLMKTDAKGNFVQDAEIDPQFVHPVGRLMTLNGAHFFFCMDRLTLQSHIVQVDDVLGQVSITPLQSMLSYPAAASLDNNAFVLLSYDHLEKRSVLSLINASGGTLASRDFDIGIGEDVEEPIINHFTGGGKAFPFLAGRVPGGPYFFNGFFNYTFSLVFTDLSQEDPLGVVQGQQDDGGFSAVVPIASTKFAAARFNFGDNFLLPNVILPAATITSSVDYPGNTLPELEANARVTILRGIVNGANTLIFGSDTKSKQIALYFYEEATGALLGSRYLGFSNPFEVAALVQTEDEGLAVCGTTYLAGRFPRFCLFKLSKEELTEQVDMP